MEKTEEGRGERIREEEMKKQREGKTKCKLKE
jgi:hypothetical protein